GADSVEADLVAIWSDLFGLDTVDLDEEFGALGGTSLLSVRMVLAIQQRYDVLVNVHRAGGGKATIRRIGEIVRGMVGDPDRGKQVIDRAEGDDDLIDADLALPLGPVSDRRAPGRDVLLTGASGFLGAFLLHELLAT